MEEQQIKKEIGKLPDRIGVYLFKGDEVLYVGKASNIRERVNNHLQASKTNTRESQIVTNTKRIDYLVTESEVDALIEENILIKLHKPKYNIRLRDDKTYPYIKLSAEEYPTLSIIRRPKDDGSKYFGPYADVGAMRSSLRTLRRLFPVRTCKKDLIKKIQRPCLYYHIGLCSGPCTGKITKQDYRELVRALTLVLEGRSDTLLQELNARMLEASSTMAFERAARLRDQINVIQKTTSPVQIVLPRRRDLDVLALARARFDSCVQVLQVKEGRLVSSESFELAAGSGDGDEEILESFLKQYYAGRIWLPPEVVVPKRLPDAKTIEEWLSKKRGEKAQLTSPRKGPKKKLLKLAQENASTHIDQKMKRKEMTRKGLEKLQETLHLPSHPSLIECFDVSTLRGRSSVGSMVTLKDGEPFKKGYRRYKIKTLVGQDDPRMIREIVYRRYRRLLEEKQDLPDLIIVDGGLTQMRGALHALKQLGADLPVIGLAKEMNNIYVKGHEKPFNLPSDSEALYILQRARDEAHRFAISYHRKLRETLT